MNYHLKNKQSLHQYTSSVIIRRRTCASMGRQCAPVASNCTHVMTVCTHVTPVYTYVINMHPCDVRVCTNVTRIVKSAPMWRLYVLMWLYHAPMWHQCVPVASLYASCGVSTVVEYAALNIHNAARKHGKDDQIQNDNQSD